MCAAPLNLDGNKFLACLPSDDAKLLLPHLSPVRLKTDQTLYEQGSVINQVYFPLDCVVSEVLIMNDGATVEVGMLGRENVVGIVTIFGEEMARNLTRVLVPGDALRMRADVMKDIFHRRQTIQRELMYSYRRLIAQINQRVACSSRHTIIQRLCCWLLMTHDRVGRDQLPLTHDSIAGRLGARRAGISQIAGDLQQMRAIRYSRGRMRIVNRSIIEQSACECYAVYRNEFEWFENCEGEKERQGESAGGLSSRSARQKNEGRVSST